jgi:antibiotic biosynthesis monooxygenase (ABM) superfamily enzyme
MTAGLPSPATVLATRTVRDGYQTEFETFLHQRQDVFAAAPGHLGLTVIRPRTPDREYALITVLAGPLLIPLPPPARFAIVTPALSALVTWAIMPALTRLFAAFLYSHDVPRSPTHRPRSNARHAREPSAYTRR